MKSKTKTILLSLGLALSLVSLIPHQVAAKKRPKHIVTVDDRNALKKHFTPAKSCSPTLAWENWSQPGEAVTWDIAIYNTYKAGMGMAPIKGDRIYYKENHSNNRITITPPLQSNQKYYWSFRKRKPNGQTEGWAWHNFGSFLTNTSYRGYPFGLKTPRQCL